MRMPQHGVQQSRHDRHHAWSQLADQLQRVDQLEFRHENHLHAAGNAEIHHRGHGEDVEQRKDAEDAVARPDVQLPPALHLIDVGRDIGVSEHRSFGRSRRPAGILQHGDRVGRDPGPLAAPVIGEQLPLGDDLARGKRRARIGELRALQQLEADRFQGREQSGKARDHGLVESATPEHCLHLVEGHGKIERHHDLGAAVANLCLDLFETVERVEIDDGAPGLQHTVVEDDEGGGVGEEKSDLDAFADANCAQSLGGAVGQFADLGEAQPLSHEIGARPLSVSLNGLVQQGIDERGPELCVPVQAWRIRPEPGPLAAMRGGRHPRR